MAISFCLYGRIICLEQDDLIGKTWDVRFKVLKIQPCNTIGTVTYDGKCVLPFKMSFKRRLVVDFGIMTTTRPVDLNVPEQALDVAYSLSYNHIRYQIVELVLLVNLP